MGKHGTGKILKHCIQCGKEFWSRHDRPGKFCSRSCGSKHRPQKDYRIIVTCEHCKNLYKIKRYRKEISRFCSRKCLSVVRGLAMRKENHPHWKGGISERTHESRAIIEQRKKLVGKCELCASIYKLEGHHKKGYKKDMQDIQILCSECHAKEHPKLRNFIRKKYG